MKPNTSETLLALIGTSLSLFLLFLVFWIPYEILSASKHVYKSNIGLFQCLGIFCVLIGVVIFIWCSSSFIFQGKGTPIPFTPTKKLIVTGLYRYVRNPIYIGGLFVLAGEALLFQSLGILLYLLIIFGIFHVLALMEETHLEGIFGDTYEQYRNSVPRWIPLFTPYEHDSTNR